MITKRRLPSSIVAIILATTIARAQQKGFDWMPPQMVDSRVRAEIAGEQIIPKVQHTKVPKKTAKKSRYRKKYTLELKKFGISNDGTNPVATSKGINAALQYAKKQGKNYIIFPKGTYLISENSPILLDHKDTIIDLNGATLQINTNGLKRYSVIEIIAGAENLRLTNGILKGDRDTHDYKTVKSSHEWGAGLRLVSGHNIEVDHMLCRDFTGDGVSSSVVGNRHGDRPALLAKIHHSVFPKHLEQGAFDKNGRKKGSTEKTRSKKPYDVSRCGGEFEFGYIGGAYGFPFIRGRVYQAYFYDAKMNFIEMQKCLQFRKVRIPKKAEFLHLEFNQPTISKTPAHYGAAKGSWIARIINFKPARHVHFHHNRMYNNRRLGMALCGGQQWIVEHNVFEKNGGTAPAFGIDIEDGCELVYDIVIRKNKFVDNVAGSLVVCTGTELLIEENEFHGKVFTWGRTHNYTYRKNKFYGPSVGYMTRTGVAKISGNTYENCKRVSVSFDTKAVADGLYRKPGETVSTPSLILENETLRNIPNITGTYFNFKNCKLERVAFTVGKDTKLLHLKDSVLIDSSVKYVAQGKKVFVKLENCKGKLRETGPGQNRKNNSH